MYRIGYIAVGNFIPYLASYLTASQSNFSIESCDQSTRKNYAENAALCNWLITAFTVGYAGCGCIGGLVQLYWDWSTRSVTILGGSVVTINYLIAYNYSSNAYVILVSSFGILFGM